MIKNKNAIGHLLAIFTVFVWGTTFISTKVLELHGIAPAEIIAVRFVLAYVIITIIKPRPIKFDKKQEPLFLLAGLSGVTAYFMLENYGIYYSNASTAGVIVSVAPVFTAIFVAIFAHEKLSSLFIFGFVISITGMCFVGFNASSGEDMRNGILGVGLVFGAAMCWGIYSVVTQKINSFGYNVLSSTKRIFFYALILLAVCLPFTGFSLDFNVFKIIEVDCHALYLGFFASAICFLTWNKSMKIIGAVKANVYIYLGPAISVIFSAVYFAGTKASERITIYQIIGMILIVAGLLLSQKKEKKNEKIFVR